MKNLKKFAALFMAASLVAGGALPALADGVDGSNQEGEATAEFSFEGPALTKNSIFHGTVPTDAKLGFIADPGGLLKKTGYDRLLSDGLLTDSSGVDSSGNLYFLNSDAVSKTYTSHSDWVTVVNRNSYDVKVEVKATVTSAGTIEFKSDSSAVTGLQTTDSAAIYLAITPSGGTSSTRKYVKSDGVTLSDAVSGVPTNFKPQYMGSGKYDLVWSDGVTASDGSWQSFAFRLEGACGGDWTEDMTPQIKVVWKVTDKDAKEEEEEAFAGYASAKSVSPSNTSVTLTLPSGVSIAKIETVRPGRDNATMTLGTHYTYTASNGRLSFVASNLTSWRSASGSILITYSNGKTETLSIT